MWLFITRIMGDTSSGSYFCQKTVIENLIIYINLKKPLDNETIFHLSIFLFRTNV